MSESIRAQIVAAVIVFRVLTFVPPILIGAVSYLFWQHNTSWRRPIGSRVSTAA